jgi:MoaA/NifB/PqqE/SkfB family radical SAM enzyme
MSHAIRAYDQEKRLNAELNRAEYLAGLVELTSLPRALFVELTQGCNLRCRMCRDNIIATKERLMPDALFDTLAEQLFPVAEMVDLRGWGESLILPDILSRIEKVVAAGARLRIVTNLSFRRPEVLNALVEADAIIAISLDTADPDTLSFLRRGSDLALITSNIEYLVRRFGHSRNLEILTTVQRPAVATLPELVAHVSSCGIRQVKLFTVTVDGPSELGLEGFNLQIDQALLRAAERAAESGVRLTAGTKLGSLPDNGIGIPRCIHPWAYTYISFKGDVSFCDPLIGPGNEEYVVGNLRESQFLDIWNGAAMQRIRGEHLNARRASAEQFAHCAWCYKQKYVDFEDRFEPLYASEIVQLLPTSEQRANSDTPKHARL